MSPKSKNWMIGVLSFFAGVIVTVIGFFVLTIYVSFIREKDDDGMTAADHERITDADGKGLNACHIRSFWLPDAVPGWSCRSVWSAGNGRPP